MIDFYIYGRKTNNIFDLLGTKENDISKAIGLSFSKAPQFLQLYLEHIGIKVNTLNGLKIKLQEYEEDKGFTDFEIEQEDEFIVIVEAKKGWNFPSQNQLDKYTSRLKFINFRAKTKKIVIFTESKKEFTKTHFLIEHSNSFDIEITSYKELWEIAKKAKIKSNNYEKRFLEDLLIYLEKLMTMKNIHSNLVYVVAVSSGQVKDWKISWIEIVKRKKYFHPIGGNGWPSEPPNYIAFRYNGKLQSIHHIDSYEVFSDPNNHFSEIPSEEWGNHFIYDLSEPIIPSKNIKTGNIFRNGRIWAMLDLLLTCDTIAEARDKTKFREGTK
jgi:hypothetical protein